MARFKVGDKVRLKDYAATCGFDIGDVVEITSTPAGTYEFEIRKYQNEWPNIGFCDSQHLAAMSRDEQEKEGELKA